MVLPARNLHSGSDATSRLTRLLVVDDDPILREYALMQLSDAGTSVETAVDGQDGWEKLQAGSYDLLLLDLHMPRLDGYGLLLRLRGDERLCNMPAVMMTTRDDMFAIDRAYEVGANSFVTKPVNWSLLKHQLRYVTRMGQTEQALREARDRLQGAADLRQNVLGLMRHETRTPLNSILGFSKILSDPGPEPYDASKAALYGNYIHEAATRLHNTLSDLQLLAEINLPDFQPVLDEHFPASVMAMALKDQETPKAGEGGPLVVDPAFAQLPACTCDGRLLARAIASLVQNALTHGRSEQPVRIAGAIDDAGALTVSVRDEGQGMSAAQIAAAAEPFLQGGDLLNRSTEGLGIGLAIASRIATLHGGSLVIESRPGSGTCASLHLPDAVEKRGMNQEKACA